MTTLNDILARLDGVPAEERPAILADLFTGDDAPDPAALSEQLAAALEEAVSSGATLSVDLLDIFDAIADVTEKQLADTEAADARARETAERVASLMQRTAPPAEEPAAEEPAEEPAAEPAAEAAAEVVAEAEQITQTAPEPAGAGALAVQTPRVPLGRNTGGTTVAKAKDDTGDGVRFNEKFTLTAAADVPGYSTGQEMTTLDFGHAWLSRMRPLITSKPKGRQQLGIAQLRREVPDDFVVFGKHDADEKLEMVTNESLLPGGSLVAAGGWCAPPERLYDLCPLRMTREGILGLPSLVARRGGIEYQAETDWSAVWGSIGFYLTEQQVIDGTEKPCQEIPCESDPVECTADVAGICLIANILSERGYPEKVAQFVEGALSIHAHEMNARRIAKMEALSTPITIPGPPAPDPAAAITDPHGPGAFESLLSILELQVQFQRYRDRLSQNATIELVAPFWVRGILKSDLRKKNGIDNRWSVSDADLDRYLRSVGVNPQWVYDWQDAYADSDPTGFGGATPPTTWPTEVKFLLYPAGTFFQLTGDVITLDGIYDSTLLKKNQYTKMFTEEMFQVCNRCGTSYVLTVDLCANGLSGALQSTQCEAPTP